MTPTKDQQAQEYVLNRQAALHNAKPEEEATMTDFDKTRKAWDAYDMEQAFEDGYTAAEQSMTDGEAPVIQRWVARDRNDNTLWMYTEKPLRDGNVMWYGKEPINLPTDFFPSLTWSDEPIECEFLIKPKKR